MRKGHSKVRWKDSDKVVLAKKGIPAPEDFSTLAEALYPYAETATNGKMFWASINQADHGPVGETVFVLCKEPKNRGGIVSVSLAYGITGKRGVVKWFGITHPLQRPAELRDVVGYMRPQ